MLELRNLTVRRAKNQPILNNISTTFNTKEMTAILGKNGAGKTTLLKAVANLIKTSGEMRWIGGETNLKAKDISYVPQLSAVHTKLTVFEMVLLGLVHDLNWRISTHQKELVYTMLQKLKLESLANQSFNTLSGGQKQLVSMGQSLISRPKILLLDEPTSALDLRHQLIVMDLAQKYTIENKAVTIFVVHDLTLASRYSDQVLMLHQAKILSQGRPSTVLTAKNIEKVYGIKANVLADKDSYQVIVPVKAK